MANCKCGRKASTTYRGLKCCCMACARTTNAHTVFCDKREVVK